MNLLNPKEQEQKQKQETKKISIYHLHGFLHCFYPIMKICYMNFYDVLTL